MVSIVIVNWNSGQYLRQCLASLGAHAPECETIVVDNASHDGSLDMGCSVLPQARVIRSAGNLGYAAGNNIGWRKSQGELVLFLNPDVACRPGAVARLAASLGRDSSLWAAGGQLLDPAGRIQVGFNVRSFPTLGSVAADMFLLDEIWPANPWTRKYRMTDWEHDSPRRVDQPAAACLMVRRAALETVGGFDEAFYPAWFEDADLCRRIHHAGGFIGYEPEARFLHHGGASLKVMSLQGFLEAFHTNQERYFRKHYGERVGRRVRRLIVAGMRLRAALSLIHPPSGRPRRESARAYWVTARRLTRTTGGLP